MKIVIAGTGYVGLVTGACLANVGHRVTCVDIDTDKIDILKQGKSPIYEPGLDELLIKNYERGTLNFTDDFQSAYRNAEVIFIGVGTPETANGSVNLDFVFTVCNQIAKNVEKDCLVIIKSTVPIGTNDEIEEFLKENLANEVNIEVASNPEFLSQGTAINDTLNASRIVIGTKSERAEKMLRKIYAPFNQPIIATDRRSAEMIKYASNDFLAVKIAYINEIANVCELLGADIETVAKGMSYDSRIGDKFLRAGLGYGGSCLPKDTKGLQFLANNLDYELKIIKSTIEINEKQKYKMFNKAKQRFGSLKGKKIAILGLTFKPGTDDLRESPSIDNIKGFLCEGAEIVAYDPVGIDNFKRLSLGEIKYVDNAETALIGADMVFIFTEWNEIKSISLDKYIELMNNAIIFDGRNCYDINQVKNKKIDYYSVGRKTILNLNNDSLLETTINNK